MIFKRVCHSHTLQLQHHSYLQQARSTGKSKANQAKKGSLRSTPFYLLFFCSLLISLFSFFLFHTDLTSPNTHIRPSRPPRLPRLPACLVLSGLINSALGLIVLRSQIGITHPSLSTLGPHNSEEKVGTPGTTGTYTNKDNHHHHHA